ncbi:hypothetical protein A3Q56_05534, partial [Intoshia linei]
MDMIEHIRIFDLKEKTNTYAAFKITNYEIFSKIKSNARAIVLLTNVKATDTSGSVVNEAIKSKLFGADIYS